MDELLKTNSDTPVQLPLCFIVDMMNTNLHTFYIDSWAHKFLHEQHSFTVAARYGTADFNIISLCLF